MIKRIAQTAGFAGLIAALVLTVAQLLWVSPLILKAETYEKAEPAAALVEENHEHAHEHAAGAVAAHEHDAQAWEPEDGWQRILSTTGGNLVVAVGFALMLAGLFTLRAPGKTSEACSGAWPVSPCSPWRRPLACRRRCRPPPPPT